VEVVFVSTPRDGRCQVLAVIADVSILATLTGIVVRDLNRDDCAGFILPDVPFSEVEEEAEAEAKSAQEVDEEGQLDAGVGVVLLEVRLVDSSTGSEKSINLGWREGIIRSGPSRHAIETAGT
jgi:hypothetical protein